MPGNNCYFPENRGFIFNAYPANPGAGNPLRYDLPGGPPNDMTYSYKLLWIKTIVTTSIVGGVRVPFLYLWDATLFNVGTAWVRTSLAAGATFLVEFAPSIVSFENRIVGYQAEPGLDLWLQTGWRIELVSTGWQAADTYTDTFMQFERFKNNS